MRSRHFLLHAHPGLAGLLSASVCPRFPILPPTLSRQWHWPACGKKKKKRKRDHSLLWLQYPDWAFTMMVAKPSYCTSRALRAAALLQEQGKQRERDRKRQEGVSSSPLHCGLARRSQVLSRHPGGSSFWSASLWLSPNVGQAGGNWVLELSL